MARIAILIEKIYEDLELQYPRLRLKEAGHEVDIVGPKAGESYTGKWGYPQKADKSARDVKAGDYALIVIPGGTSPTRICTHVSGAGNRHPAARHRAAAGRAAAD